MSWTYLLTGRSQVPNTSRGSLGSLLGGESRAVTPGSPQHPTWGRGVGGSGGGHLHQLQRVQRGHGDLGGQGGPGFVGGGSTE